MGEDIQLAIDEAIAVAEEKHNERVDGVEIEVDEDNPILKAIEGNHAQAEARAAAQFGVSPEEYKKMKYPESTITPPSDVEPVVSEEPVTGPDSPMPTWPTDGPDDLGDLNYLTVSVPDYLITDYRIARDNILNYLMDQL